LIDSNVYFAKRLGDALKREGFDVVTSTQAAYALTMLEYDTPTAILCATNLREMGALEIAKIVHADPKNVSLPIVALGDRSRRAAYQRWRDGCRDFFRCGRDHTRRMRIALWRRSRDSDPEKLSPIGFRGL